MMSFDAASHITKIKGKDYLEVKWRIVWFREEHPAEEGWGIITKPLNIEEELAVYRAEIVDPEGRVVATGVKSETPKGFEDFIEKAETGSIGRALALLGYGTQWCADELDEGKRIVDSPVQAAPEPEPAGPPPSYFDEQGRPLHGKALANALKEAGIEPAARRTKLAKEAAEIALSDGNPKTPEDFAKVLECALQFDADEKAAKGVAR